MDQKTLKAIRKGAREATPVHAQRTGGRHRNKAKYDRRRDKRAVERAARRDY